jgi:tetratricopeptide (TPR) repeat protein
MPLAEIFSKATTATQPVTEDQAKKSKIVSEALLAYFQAKEAVFDQDFPAAIRHLNKAIELDADYVAAHRLLMTLAIENDQLTLAEKEAKTVLRLAPDDPMAHYTLGSLLLESNQPVPAMAHLYRAVTIWDEEGNRPRLERLLAAFKLGGVLAGQGYLNAAIDVYQSLATKMEQLDGVVQDVRIKRAIDVYLPGVYLLLGEFSFKLNRYPEAVSYYEKAGKFSGIERPAGVGRIRCYLAMNKAEQARELLDELGEKGLDKPLIELYQKLYPNRWAEKVVQIYLPEKDNLAVGVAVAGELIRGHENESAIDLLKKILVVNPADTDAIWLMVRAYQAGGQSDQAARFLFKKVIEADGGVFSPGPEKADLESCGALEQSLLKLTIEPDKAYAKSYLQALVSQIESKQEQAEQYFQTALKQRKDFLPAYVALGQLYLGQRKWSKADRLMDQALAEELKSGRVYYIKGKALAELNEPKASLKALESAAKLSPDSGRILLSLIEGHLWNKDAPRAADVLKRLIGGQLAGADTLVRLGELMLDANNPSMGEVILQQYRQRFGEDVSYRLLTARKEYLEDRDVAKYRTQLSAVSDDSLRAGLRAKWRAELEFDMKKYRKSAEIAGSALDQYPQMDADEYKRLMRIDALSNWKLLNYDRAEWAWRQLMTDWPGEQMNSLALAKMLMDAQAFDKVEPLVSELLKTETNPARTFQLRVWLIASYVARDQMLDVLKTLDRWLDVATDEEKPRYRKMKIDALLQKEYYPEALNLLEQFLEKEVTPLKQWQQTLVSVLAKMNAQEKALAAIDRFEARAGDEDRSFYNELRIPLLLELEEFDRAIDLAKQALETKDTRQRFMAVLTLIECYRKAGRYAEAQALTRDEAKAVPASSLIAFTLRQQLARTMEVSGKSAEAEQYIQDQIAQSEGDVKNKWQQWLIALYFSRGETDKAIPVLEDILAVDPNLAWASNSLGYTLADRGRDLDRAEQLIRNALADEPESASYLDSLGWVLYRQGKFEQAYHYAQMAWRGLSEPDPVVLDHLGDICLKLGKLDEAESNWRQSVKASEGRDTSSLEPDMPARMLRKLAELKSLKSR